MSEQPTKKYKVIVLGDAGVGKTTLTYRFCEGLYRDNLRATVGVDIRVKKVEIDNETITLNIWDTAGMEKNRNTLTSHYYRNLNAVILVYDVTQPKTFENLARWLEEVDEHSDNEVIKIILGNKCDEESLIDRQRVQRFADAHGIPLFETSAKLDSEQSNLEGIFLTIAHKLKANSSFALRDRQAIALTSHITKQPSSCWC